MSWIDGLRHRMRSLSGETEYEQEVEAEFSHHVDLDAAHQGDRDAARRRFGNRTWYKEEARRMTWLGSLDVLRQDARYAWRSLSRTPGFTLMVIVTLTLGIGANAALFSFLDRLFVRMPAGVVNPGELHRVWADVRAIRGGRTFSPGIGYPTLLALRELGEGKAEVALYSPGNRMYLGRDRTPPGLSSEYATGNLFRVLGVRPALGRFFAPDEDIMGSPVNVVVLSHAFWLRKFKGDSSIVGQAIPLGLRQFTVIGVAPPAFRGLDAQAPDLWIPLATLQGNKRRGKDWWFSNTTYGARGIVRASASLDRDAFVARTTVTMRRTIIEDDPRFGDSLYAVRLGPIIEARGPGPLGQDLVTATRLGAVALVVLLIAFANVLGLLLARAVSRQREIALRLALGISRARLARMLTTETLLLSVAAGVAAIIASSWGGSVLRSLLLPNVQWTESPVDARVVVFTMTVAVVAGLLAGVVPALQATNVQLGALKEVSSGHGPRQAMVRSSFIVAQVAFSVVLVVTGVLFVRSLQNVLAVPLGVDSDRLVFAQMGFETGEAPADSIQARAFRDVARRLQGRPGFDVIARASAAPMRGYSMSAVYLDGDSTKSFGNDNAGIAPVSVDYFRATGLKLKAGSLLSADDASGVDVPREVVVNARMAQVYWPGQDPIGQCLHLNTFSAPCHRVVGVVDQQRRMNVIENEITQYYVALGGKGFEWWNGTSIIVRTRPETRGRVVAELQSALKQAYPQGYPYIKMMTENLDAEYRPWRVSARLFGVFGALALLVALVGIYSSVAYGVTRRTREFGVRIALGAHARDVVNLIVGEGLRTVAIGVGLGVVLSLGAGRLLASMLFGVAPTDVSAIMLSSCSLLLVAALAAAVPAWRAARVDPVAALRAE